MDPLVVTQIIVAAVQDILFAIAVGALMCSAMFCLRYENGPSVSVGLGRSRLAALGALAFACVVYLWLEAAVMGGTPFVAAGSVVGAVLTQSHFGVAWSVSFAGALLACFGGARHSRTGWCLAALGMIVYVAGKAAASHAADAGDFTLREAVHALHLSATALWAGSVVVAAPLPWYWKPKRFAIDPVSAGNRVAFCTQLSHLATFALVIVIVTGIYNVTQDTAHVTLPLLGELYGRLLTLKLAFVTLAASVGAYNRMALLPRLRTEAAQGAASYYDAQQAFDRLLLVEAIAMLAILAVAAVLGHTSP